MTDARSQILSNLATNLPPPDELNLTSIEPSFIGDADDLSNLLRQNLQAVHSQVEIAASANSTVRAIAGFLQAFKLPFNLGGTDNIAIDPALFAAHNIEITYQSKPNFLKEKTAIVRAKYAIAETGSLVLPSAEDCPTLANLLPENVIILIRQEDILPSLESGLLAVKESDAGMPRSLNLITGPSKTGDIEQTIVFGAHGPIRLQVIIEQYYV